MVENPAAGGPKNKQAQQTNDDEQRPGERRSVAHPRLLERCPVNEIDKKKAAVARTAFRHDEGLDEGLQRRDHADQ
jgi:hypothetical protein